MKKISYIFPVYNNALSLNTLYKEMNKVMAGLKYDYEYIFVNDGSKDNSREVIQKLANKDKKVKAIFLSRNFGHQAAVTAGLDVMNGDAVIIMDADMQDPPRVCPDLIKEWENGADVVYAQRRTRKDSFVKKQTATIYYRILSAMSSVDIPRDTGDFRLADRKVVEVVQSMKEYNRFLRGMFSFVGFKQVGVQFDRDARLGGKSEYTFKKMMGLAKDGLFGFSDIPLRFMAKVGYFISMMSIVGIIYALIIKFFYPSIAVSGWTITIVAIFFIGGTQLIMLGLLGEYIARIYNEVRERPTYIIDEKLNLK